MKVLLINGSPNERGSTYTALRAVADVLNGEGIETEIIHGAAKPAGGCIACGGCRYTHRCVFNDDAVNACVDALKEADGLIVGAPVYYASPNGTAISLLDRLFRAGGAYVANKPASAVVVARRAGTSASLEVINKYFTIAQMPVVSSTYWNMVYGACAEDVPQDLEGMQTMRNLGRNMAWLLHCIEAGRKAGIADPQLERGNKTNFIR